MKRKRRITPYTTVWIKTRRKKWTSFFLGVCSALLAVYILFVFWNVFLLMIFIMLLYAWRRARRECETITYHFEQDKIRIQYDGTTKDILRSDIGRVRKVLKSADIVWIHERQNQITKDAYFTTATENVVCIFMRNHTNILISPTTIKPWILSYYDSPRLLDRF